MAIDDRVLHAPVAALGPLLRAGDLSPVALAEAYLARIERWQPASNAFVTVTRERALADARAAEGELAAGKWRGPLHGIPCGLQDIVDTKGIRTTFGARPYADRVPDRDAAVVSRLAEAGAVLLGKLSTIELAGGLGYRTGEAAFNGPCRNPWDLTRWAGGASSGPAAAVAAGLVGFAIGSETWGSLVMPAALCGATALRPTHGVVPIHGAMAVTFTMDKLGPLARAAGDCALVLAAIAGADPRDPSSVARPRGIDRVKPELPAGLRIAALAPRDDAPSALRDAFGAARAVFQGAGAIVEDAVLPDLPWTAVARLVIRAEAANAFEELIRSGRTRDLSHPAHGSRSAEDYLPRANAADYVRAQRLRGEMQRALARFFERHDAVLAPSLPWTAPRVDEDLLRLPEPGAISAAGNLAGLPAVALPMGFANGLPLGMQLVGEPFDDARVLAAAAFFQARTRFHLERPPEPAAPQVVTPPSIAAAIPR